ncbi:hypothetical protein CHY_1377 [Carboxydothermus hydrogenoformans Z-2901]|uniref:Uncharacterized protein n=1 Tax=Carboxydothermus hydrogenoformans (strain ATCC BAA-161 / DSM 6008 / Z-2901) TaxID=246194 RepID=Q3ACC5_CARHZ|nr:hypothetical protein CHY_1377 [Carboxydothermus hydrogenoformans Z-2901]
MQEKLIIYRIKIYKIKNGGMNSDDLLFRRIGAGVFKGIANSQSPECGTSGDGKS